MSHGDFPKYEEKSGYGQGQMGKSLGGKSLKDKRRKLKRKRGRKPRNYADDEEESEVPQSNTYQS